MARQPLAPGEPFLQFKNIHFGKENEKKGYIEVFWKYLTKLLNLKKESFPVRK